jgi:hypothetical protein
LDLFAFAEMAEKKEMEKRDVESELSALLSRTLALEDELNSLVRMDD